MDSKTRSALCAIASGISAAFQIGKGEIGENTVSALKDYLDKNEIVKLSVLKGSDMSPAEIMEFVAGQLDAEPVRVIGNKVILYRKSSRKDAKHII